MASEQLQRLSFYLSLVFLSVVYGVAASLLGWFPSGVLTRALDQADRLTSPPRIVSSRSYERTGATTHLPGRVTSGVTAITSLWKSGDDWILGLRLIDSNGRVLHSWTVGPETLSRASGELRGFGFDELFIHGSKVLPNGDVLVNLEYAGTVRLNACGQVRWYLPGGSHHSISRASDGTFWIPGVSERPSTTSPEYPGGLPGFDRPVYHDYLRRVSADGEVLERINVLDLLYGNGLARHIIKFPYRVPRAYSAPRDITHLNDVEPLPPEMANEYPLFEAGDLLVSLRNLDLVFVVDPQSESIKWHASHPFLRQHDPDFLVDGWIGVFDNTFDGTRRGTFLGGSRIVALQPHTSAQKVLFPTDQSEPFYTSVGGKWQELANGNLLLVEAEAGRIVEVAPDGRTVWEWIVAPYDEELVPLVTDAARVELTEEQVAAWPCSPGDSLDGRESSR